MTIISQMIESAATKPAFTHVEDTETTIRRVMPNSAHDLRYLNLKELSVKFTLNDGPDAVYNNTPAGVLPDHGHPGYNSQVAVNALAQHSVVVGAGRIKCFNRRRCTAKERPIRGRIHDRTASRFYYGDPGEFSKGNRRRELRRF